VAVFTSDNGYHWGEHSLIEKFSPYTESVQVPLLVRWPGRITGGTTDPRYAANVDVLPSVLAATGVTPTLRHPIDGRAFLTATGLSSNRRSEAFIEQFVDAFKPLFPAWASVRTTAFQYTEWYTPAGAVQFREYYNLTTDRHELVNLLGDGIAGNDPNVTAVSTRLRAYRTCRGATCP
jgi:N-acetylglucosamine-6-sulfatase